MACPPPPEGSSAARTRTRWPVCPLNAYAFSHHNAPRLPQELGIIIQLKIHRRVVRTPPKLNAFLKATWAGMEDGVPRRTLSSLPLTLEFCVYPSIPVVPLHPPVPSLRTGNQIT